MTAPNNNLVNVQTYQMADMAWMLNEYVAMSLSNKMFENFQGKIGNLGTSVSFDLTPRYRTYNGLVVTQQQTTQRQQTLTVSQAANTSFGFTNQQLLYNVDEYIDKLKMAGAKELGNKIEADILKNFVSGVIVSDPTASNYGQKLTSSGPYRFYGDGVAPINSYGQLAQAIANFEDYGAATSNLVGVLPTVAIPAIVQNQQNNFTPATNDEIVKKWMVGEFSGCMWSKSNLLPTHVAGSIGNAGNPNNIMTVVSTNDATGANVTQITFTEPTSSTSATAIRSGDIFEFVDGVAGFDNMRFRQFIGHEVSSQKVQFVAIADSASTAGSVTVTLRTTSDAGLVWAQNANQNLNQPIQAGMKVKVIPTHKAGIIMSGDPLYLGMPRLPDEVPYPTANESDPDTGIAIRHYYGSMFGQNNRVYVRDAIWGSTLVPENCMRLVFPV
jgi:hypothetical protein